MRVFLTFAILMFSTFAFSYEDHVQYESGYYYVVIKKEKFDRVNAELIEQINKHGWQVIHTINVDKTINISKPYKTHLLCRGDYLKKGLEYFKLIGVIIPCRITIFQDKDYIKIAVEDIREIAKMYRKNSKFYRFMMDVEFEMIDILNRTADKFSKKQLIPQY